MGSNDVKHVLILLSGLENVNSTSEARRHIFMVLLPFIMFLLSSYGVEHRVAVPVFSELGHMLHTLKALRSSENSL